ncbi:catalase, partial [Escherichia coli]
TLSFDAQETFSDARRVWADDVLAFSPWNGIEAHRPLGSIMRIRRHVYQASSGRRHRLNAITPAEPRSAADIPN